MCLYEFLAAGQYKVVLGKSFDVKPKKKAPKYFNVSNRVSSDRLGYGSEIKLEGKKKKVQVEMKHNQSTSTMYDAELKTEEEFNCILIYNEETKTITLERQSAQINLTRKIIEPQRNGQLSDSPLPGNPYANLQTPPMTSSNNVVQAPAVVEDSNLAGGDDFDFDLSKDMDEILDSDDEEDSGSDTFEEIAAPVPIQQQHPMNNSPLTLPITPTLPSSPNIPMNLALPTTPTTLPASSPSSSNNATTTTTTAAKKRKFKMASAPIRHPGMISPMAAAPTPPPVTLQQNNNTYSGKRPKVNHDDQSSSGSEEDDSSSGSESGSTETGSSSGESESDSGSDSDDDFESLAQDISMSLSKGGPSAPASPQQQQQQYHQQHGVSSPSNYKRSPYESTPGNTPTPSNSRQPPPSQQNGSAGPMSLRALFKEDDEEEGLSSSSSDDDDDD